MSAAAEMLPDSPGALQAALELAEEYGRAVFPCRPDKRPYTDHGFTDASADPAQIRAWWARWPDALVGVPTGAANNLLTVDIDPAGADWYREHHDRLHCGRIHRTRRGHHLVYTMPEAEIRCSAGKLAPGVDVRAEGGYVIWWPAHGLGAIGDFSDIGPPPGWLLERLRGPAPPFKGRESAPQGVVTELAVGGRNDYLSRESYRLRKQGLASSAILEVLRTLNATRCAPPLEDEEVRGIVERKVRNVEPEAHVEAERPARAPLDWRALEAETPPERAWAIEHWLPMGHVTLLAGAPGTGKTLIAQAIGSCLALRREYLDWIAAERRVLLWACEDEAAELWRRQAAIARWLDVPLSAFAERLIVHSYAGQLCELAALQDQRLVPAPMLSELREQIGDYRADVAILDNSARLFAGNENDRHQVTSFIAMLTAAAAPTGAAVMLLAHPGKAAGSEYSGSTAWEGAVRGRLYLGRTLPDAEGEGDEAEDDGVRYLCRRKANYSARDWRRLRYHEGVMVPEALPEARASVGTEYAQEVVRRAVTKLAAMGEHGVAATGSSKYLPRLARDYQLLERLSEKQFAAAMRSLRTAGELVMAVVGRYSNRAPREALTLATDTGSAQEDCT